MDKSFHTENRRELYASLPDGALLVMYSGELLRQTADASYPFFANVNFRYLTGLAKENLILLARRSGGETRETVFIPRPDPMAERWTGTRLKADEVREISGIEDVAYTDGFARTLQRLAGSGSYDTLWLDLDGQEPDEPVRTPARRMAAQARESLPFLQIKNVHPRLSSLRTIKRPCEIEAMLRAMEITREGILAMMRVSRPGISEREYKAEFDRVMTAHGVFTSSFPPIISAGANNFCIHYYGYTGTAQDGDMVLNDVGANYDGLYNDVSRGWPCNGRFTERQRLLYGCAYDTSEHMFSIIRPGMPMRDVDRLIKEYCGELLVRRTGLISSQAEVGRLMWHGGAHHLGWDVHDEVELTPMDAAPIRAGMVFCVDVGIYCEEWGIGFRLEDNCLVTEDGCVNLSAAIPRSIEEIEAAMAK